MYLLYLTFTTILFNGVVQYKYLHKDIHAVHSEVAVHTPYVKALILYQHASFPKKQADNF